MYELFDHTADLGLRVVAEDLESLFRDAAEGLFSIIVESVPPPVDPRKIAFHLAGERADLLLLDWLGELLYVFDTQRVVLSDFHVAIDGQGLRATALSQPLDPKRHRLLHEVKAVTYHRLRVEPTDRGWLAELILDI